MASIERPGSKDILVGRGHTVFNHIGNRRFRQLVDLFVQEYVESSIRSDKTAIVRKVIGVLYKAGYRFLQPDAEGIFAELSMQYVLKKVGHALRDRSPLLDQHLARNLKTLAELAQMQITPMEYAEAVTSGEEQDQWRKERYYTLNSENRLRQLWVRPRGFSSNKNKPENKRDAASAATCLLKLSAVTKDSKEQKAKKELISKTPPAVEHAKRKKAPSQQTDNENSNANENARAPRPARQKKYIKTVNEIVVPTMQSGSLPIGGNWKFFPLPELQNKIDLGPTDQGWTLKLEPIAFTADTISLDVLLP